MDAPPDAPPAPELAYDETPPASTPPATPPPASTPPKPRLVAQIAALTLRLILAIALVLLGLYAAIWSYLFAVEALGPLGLLGFALAVGLLIAVIGPWLLIRHRALVRRALVGVARWLTTRVTGASRVASGAPATPPLPATRRSAGLREALARLLGVRFVWDRTAGVWVTLGLVAASAFAWAFAELLFQVVTGGTVASTDLRVLNLVATLRTPTLDQVMYAFTFLASAPAIVAITAVALGIALLLRRYADTLLIVLGPIAGGLFVLVVKYLVARPRPPLVDARIVADTFSFPSGHATIGATLYGTLAYLLLNGWHRRYDAARILIAVGTALLIFAIGLSRIYLGVHYPSDVLAGWAAGAFWLALVMIAEHLWLPLRAPPLSTSRRVFAVVGSVLLAGLASAYLYAAYPTLPASPITAVGAPISVAPNDVQATVVGQLPHVTESLFGAPQEPISLVFVGTRPQLEQAFTAAGWTEAEPPEPGAVGQALFDLLTAQPDPAGPVAPSFLADQPNALAFSQPVGVTFAQRHHARLWSANVVTNAGQPVWLGTASFDEGFGLSRATLLPTHHIAPNIDAERDYLVSALTATGLATASSAFQLVPPESGHNFVGDPFTTDGQAVLLVLQ